jgi:hypothetical protein
LPGDPVEFLRQVVQDINALGNTRVYFVDLSNTLTDPKTDYGCDGHASVVGDRKIAAKVSTSMKIIPLTILRSYLPRSSKKWVGRIDLIKQNDNW